MVSERWTFRLQTCLDLCTSISIMQYYFPVHSNKIRYMLFLIATSFFLVLRNSLDLLLSISSFLLGSTCFGLTLQNIPEIWKLPHWLYFGNHSWYGDHKNDLAFAGVLLCGNTSHSYWTSSANLSSSTCSQPACIHPLSLAFMFR